MAYELLIQNGNNVYQPVVIGDITWKTERKSYPGELKFDIVMDDTIKNITEGNAVRLRKDNNNIFFGFIFSKKTDKEKVITNLNASILSVHSPALDNKSGAKANQSV